jgi:hypothetical protein
MNLLVKKSAPPALPNWHPNFRHVEALPDLKVIRTSFFVNVLFITIATAALLFTAFREYAAFSMRAEIREAERHMEELGPRNGTLLALSREFTEAHRKFNEATEFTKAPFIGSELLVALSRSLPATMDFTSVIYEDKRLVLRGTVRGASDSASNEVTRYLDVLRQDPLIGANFPDVSTKGLVRDPRSQELNFDILLSPKPEAPKAKQPKTP